VVVAFSYFEIFGIYTGSGERTAYFVELFWFVSGFIVGLV